MTPPRVDYVRRFWQFFRELFADNRCLGCHRSGGRLCAACMTTLPRATPTCIGCTRHSRDGRTCARCAATWPVDTLVAAHPYRAGTVERLVRSFKYRLEYPLAEHLAHAMSASLARTFPERPVIVPVPLHEHRRRWRGFDQAAVLARAVSQYTLFPYCEVLERTRNTPQQAKAPSRSHRLTAMQDAFRVTVPDPVAACDVILVDDVCTTGATLGACAAVLRDAGAASVTALVYARK